METPHRLPDAVSLDQLRQATEKDAQQLPSRARNRKRVTLRRIIRDTLLTVPVLALLLWLLFLPGSQSEETLPQSSAQSAAQSAGIETAFDYLEVSGRVGATPVINLTKPISLAGAKERVYEEGKGRVIEDGQPVLLAITAFDGNSGELLNPSGRAKLQVGFATPENFERELLKAVVGHTEGSRVVVVRRLRDDKLAPGATSPFEIDVVDILPSIATGTPQDGVNGKPLTVELGEIGPRMTHQGEPPTNLATQLLLKGDGPQVEKGDKIVAQYIMSRWSDGVVRQSTWDRGVPELIDLSTAMPGLVQALTDQRVGSRIAITIPPDLATGEDTMTVVVDILGASAGVRETPKNANSSQSGNPSQSGAVVVDRAQSGQSHATSQSGAH